MKKLNLFQSFDFGRWQQGKTFAIQGIKYNDKKHCVSLDIIITEDKTDYGDKSVSNVYEKFKIHCIQDTDEADVDKYQLKDEVKVLKVGKCTDRGEYSNQLSIEAVVEVVKK